MSVSKWCLRLILLINLVLWGMYLVGWDWQGFKSYSPNIRLKSFGLEFWKYNVFHIIIAGAWFTGLMSLVRSHWSSSINFAVSAIMFWIFTYVSWSEHRFDNSVGASRGALESLLLSATCLAANLWALWHTLHTKLKPSIWNPFDNAFTNKSDIPRAS